MDRILRGKKGTFPNLVLLIPPPQPKPGGNSIKSPPLQEFRMLQGIRTNAFVYRFRKMRAWSEQHSKENRARKDAERAEMAAYWAYLTKVGLPVVF